MLINHPIFKLIKSFSNLGPSNISGGRIGILSEKDIVGIGIQISCLIYTFMSTSIILNTNLVSFFQALLNQPRFLFLLNMLKHLISILILI